jgi:ribonuclease D
MANSDVIGLDTESNGRHHYPEQLCLVQIATRHRIYVIDTISISDITSLAEILSDVRVVKVIHESAYDLLCLDRRCGLRIHPIFDTAVAARITGIARFGLASVIESVLGIRFEKNTRLQKADWGIRPLSTEALQYAANDVRHLIDLRNGLVRQLTELGRMHWITEECSRLEDIRYRAPDIENAYLTVKGARKLEPQNLAVLQTLFEFRDEEAMRQCRPPYQILSEETLLYLASNPTVDLSKIPGLGNWGIAQFGKTLRQAIKSGLSAPPIHINLKSYEFLNEDEMQKLKAIREEQFERLVKLKAWRLKIGTSLSVSPFLLWPTASLERLSMDPESLNSELMCGDIRRWQKERFGESLRIQLRSLS